MRTTANDLIESIVAQISDLRQEVTSIRSAKVMRRNLWKQIVMVEKKRRLAFVGCQAPIVSDGKSFPLEYWDSITERLNELLNTLKELLYVPSVVIQKIFPKFSPSLTYNFSTVCYYIKECCSLLPGEHLKERGLALELDTISCAQAHDRGNRLSGYTTEVLSIHKLYKLRTFYSHNSDDTNSVSPDVISKFKVLMSEDSNDPDSDSYLLDDNSNMAIPVEEISKSINKKDFSNIKPTAELLESSEV
ncbi:hypothetical protein Tco_0396897 [Tanacetum coccineum]